MGVVAQELAVLVDIGRMIRLRDNVPALLDRETENVVTQSRVPVSFDPRRKLLPQRVRELKNKAFGTQSTEGTPGLAQVIAYALADEAGTRVDRSPTPSFGLC